MPYLRLWALASFSPRAAISASMSERMVAMAVCPSADGKGISIILRDSLSY